MKYVDLALVRFCCLLAVLLVSSVVHAEPRRDLYVTEHEVPDQSAPMRNRAIKEGFDALLVRLSGFPEAPAAAGVAAARQRASSYVQEFRYRQKASEGSSDGDITAPATTVLELHFSESAMLTLLRQAGLPFWPADRPQVLVWLVANDYGEGLHWLAANSDIAGLNKTLEAQGDRFGVVFTAPLLDLQDVVTLSPEQAWGLDANALSDASERYGADVIVLGRYAKTSSGEWMVNWNMWQKDSETVFDSRNSDPNDELADALAQVAVTLAKRYAIVPSVNGPEGLVVDVQNVNGFAPYQQVIRYLEQLPMVSGVQMAGVAASNLSLTLFTEGDLTLLLERLQRDGRLEYIQAIDSALPAWQRQPIGSPANPLRLRVPAKEPVEEG